MRAFLKNLFRYRGAFAVVSWIVVLVYAGASINLLLISINWYKHYPGAYLDPFGLIGFAVVSFLLVVLVSVYHLSSLIRRRKRRTDRQRLSRAKFVRAKHRLPPRHVN